MSTKEEKEALSLVTEKHEYSYNVLSPLFERFNELEDLYWFHLPKTRKQTSKSTVFDPIAFEQVEHVVSSLFAKAPRGSFTPMEPTDERKIQTLEQLVKYQWNRPGQNMRRKMANMGRNMSIFGTAFGMLNWKYERKLDKNKKQFYTAWDDPYFEDLNIYDCWPDVDAKSPDDMQYFGFDEYVTYEDLVAQNSGPVKRYKNLDKVKELIKDKIGQSGQMSENGFRTNASERRQMGRGLDVNKIRCLARRLYIGERCITILPDYNTVIEDHSKAIDELPILTLLDHDYPGLLYGIGEIDPIRTLAIAQNQMIGMRMDNVKVIMEPPIQARASAMKFSHTWKMQRNHLWVVNQIGDVQPFSIPDSTGGTFHQTTNFFQDTIARRLGRLDIISRNESNQNRTATEIKAAYGEQNNRLRYKEGNIDEFVKQLMVKWAQLNQQFLKKDKVIRVLGVEALEPLLSHELQSAKQAISEGENYEPKLRINQKKDVGFLTISPEDISGAYDYQVESGSMKDIDTTSEIQAHGQALQLVAQYAPILAQSENTTVKFRPLIENILNKLNIKNTDKILESVPIVSDTQPTANSDMQPGIQSDAFGQDLQSDMNQLQQPNEQSVSQPQY